MFGSQRARLAGKTCALVSDEPIIISV